MLRKSEEDTQPRSQSSIYTYIFFAILAIIVLYAVYFLLGNNVSITGRVINKTRPAYFFTLFGAAQVFVIFVLFILLMIYVQFTKNK